MKNVCLSAICVLCFAPGLLIAQTLVWDPQDNRAWTVNATGANWTADSGSTYEAWTQAADAVFNGDPTLAPLVSGGRVLFNSILATNLTADLSLGRVSGGDADHLWATNTTEVTVADSARTLNLPQVHGNEGLVKLGPGIVATSRGWSYSGGTKVMHGTFQGAPGSGTMQILNTQGTANARWYIRGVNSSWTNSMPIVVPGGSTGKATIENSTTTGSGFHPGLSGSMALTNTLFIKGDTRIGSHRFILSGAVSGPGTLELDFQGWGNGTTFVLSGDNTGHTGPLFFLCSSRTSVTGVMDSIQGNMNIYAGTNVTLTGTGTLICNIVNGTPDKIALQTGSTFDASGFTLQPVLTGTSPGEYVIMSPRSRVSGTFAAIAGSGFTVQYGGTATYPDDVVLVFAPEGTVFMFF